MKNPLRPILFAATVIAMLSGLSWIVGCGTTAQSTAQQGVVATDASVRLAMTGWGLYVGVKHPGTNAEQQVYTAFEQVKSGELAVVAAARAIGTNTDLTLLEATTLAYSASKSNLFNIIGSLTNSP